MICANILPGTNNCEPWKDCLTPLLSRDVATKTVVLIVFTVHGDGKDLSPRWCPKLGDVVLLTTLEGDGLGVEGDGLGVETEGGKRVVGDEVGHVGGHSVPLEWHHFNFFKSWKYERER